MQFIGEATGIDAGRPGGNKKINRRNRSIAVDCLGLPWSLAVTLVNTSDNEVGKLVVDRLQGRVSRLVVTVTAADPGCEVSFIEHVEEQQGWKVEIAQNRTAEAARK